MTPQLGHVYNPLVCSQAAARVEMAKVDLLLVPTALQHYTVQEVLEQEELAPLPTWPRNGNLGRFTNFVNLLDMCGIAVPSGLLRGAPQLLPYCWPLRGKPSCRM